MSVEIAVKIFTGVSALAVSWGSKRIIASLKDEGYQVPEWLEELAPAALGLATNLGVGRYIDGPPQPQRNGNS
ncbi:hypothetical protein ACWGCI_02495 [Streptomyces sp. NPDC054949]|uniref:hypothetical protein n=1 Tax=unclassified Streptomyces TaxID=2593676 RepID=UPI0022509C85|nr:hypothetical protein [Streptomyces sp. NBC_00424]MCX5079343.1 hypothetical protein [Streptomyces sp. NBC_00424]WUD39246.1 hypothetical protein OHA84_01315 [Streptomyces sp. NBC_00513]